MNCVHGVLLSKREGNMELEVEPADAFGCLVGWLGYLGNGEKADWSCSFEENLNLVYIFFLVKLTDIQLQFYN